MSTSQLQGFNQGDLAGMIEYEIRMLRFCIHRLDQQSGSLSDEEGRVYLECFLLHYRNLIRFFSGREHRKGDVSMGRPQVFCDTLPKERVEWYKTQVQTLDNEDANCEHKLISKLLQHCTEKRVDLLGHKWPVSEMYKKIESVLNSFEQDCLKRSVTKVLVAGEISNDTMTRSPMLQIGYDRFAKD